MGLLANLLRSVDDLVKLGYPESVAERIVSGELDMRADAKIERQKDMFPTTAFHGGGDDIRAIDPNRITSGKTANTGFFMSSSPINASSYAERAGNVMPLAVDTRGFDVVNAGGNEWNRIVNPDYLLGGERLATFGDLPGYQGNLEPDRGIFDINVVRDFDIDELARTARRLRSPGLIVKDVQDIGPNYKAFDAAFEAATGLKLGDEGYQEVLDRFSADTIVASDPTRVRSLLAAFDPEYTGPNILGSAAGTAGALGLLAAPEEAEAGVAKSAIQAAMAGVRTPQDFLSALERLGASPEQAAQIARGELSPSKIGVSSQNASLLPVIDRSGGLIDARFDPRVNSRIRNAELETGILSRGTMDDIPRVALSDLEGQRFVTSMSDRTAAGGLLESINGVNLNNLINLQGGQGFMFENPGMVWASAPNPVNQILTASGGENVFYLPWRMAPSGGDFATKTGETMLSYASANMSKAEKKSLDKLIKDYKTTGTWDKDTQSYKGAGLQISGWKGIDDPSSIEAWRNAPDALRKELMNAMDVEFRDRGGLSIGEARLAVTDPDQRFAMDGGIQNVGQIFGGQPAIIGSGHPSYPAGVPGQGVGRLDQLDMSIFDLIPDARIGSDQVLVREAVDPTNPNPEALRALQMKPYSGVVTEDILKTLDARGVNVNDLAPYIGGGAALGLLAAPEDAEAGFITRGGRTLLEAFHGSPYQFDRFDMSKIGTGEGAQAYGHGLYFADSEDVAKQYRDELSETLRPKTWIPRLAEDNNIKLESHAIDDFRLYGNAPNLSVEEAADAIIKSVSKRKIGQDSFSGERSDLINAITQFREETLYGQPMGSLYRTEIDVTPESLLDWDKPLSGDTPQQMKDSINALVKNNPDLKDALYQAYREGQPGSIYYSLLSDHAKTGDIVKNQQFATQQLNDAGIKGIKYLDGNSRHPTQAEADIANEIRDLEKRRELGRFMSGTDGVPDLSDSLSSLDKEIASRRAALKEMEDARQTSNYVIFDDSLVNIADRYAIAPPMFAPSQDRALAAANQGLLDPLTVDEQRIQQHQRDINKQMAQIGLLADPMYEYGNIIPAKTNIVTGETSLAFPAIARDIIGGLLDLANTRRSGVYNPTALMDVAL